VELGRLAVSLPAPFVPARDCIELGRRAEAEWGYPAIWLAETNGPDSFSLAGALAMVTSRATIGTAIVPVYNRTPAVLAMTAATLGSLAPGRFVLGLGSSSHAIVEEWNGVPFEQPLAHVRESVAILRRPCGGDRLRGDGRSRGLAPARSRLSRSTSRSARERYSARGEVGRADLTPR
jgi:alkanesulfonate monooxygenase SsuD/methylene tetrahydromethanopterin reductase-like flavin-dependent oxidoreductase (luciferase family)